MEDPIHSFFKSLLSAFSHKSFKERKKKDNRKDINEFLLSRILFIDNENKVCPLIGK